MIHRQTILLNRPTLPRPRPHTRWCEVQVMGHRLQRHRQNHRTPQPIQCASL